MGIREDIDAGLGQDEYILVRSVVKVLAKNAKATPQEVARWLIRKNCSIHLWGYTKDEHGQPKSYGNRDPRTKQVSRFENAKGSKQALHMIESDSTSYLPIYWQIPELMEWLKEKGQEIEKSLFAEEARAARERAKRKDLLPASDHQSAANLRARVADLENEVARLRLENEVLRADVALGKGAGEMSFRHETRGLRLVAEVQERYLGDNYSHDDLDSRPSKESVLEWLRDKKGVKSDAEAAAIDRVAMPFDRGSKKTSQ